MSSQNFEIEIKTLLGSKENADALISRMKQHDPQLKEFGEHKQLNHYFAGGDLKSLFPKIKTHLTTEQALELEQLIEQTKDFSMRSRWADDKVIFVLKASVDDTTASNGTARREFEATVKMSLEELDKILLDSGFEYLSKWSRERKEYSYKGANITVDRNAGYGYLAEFEMVDEDASKAEQIKTNLRNLMQELEVAELNQDRLARMFDFYNKNWPDYYGTEKVFTIE